MFVDLAYMHIYDNEFDDEKVDENHFEEPWVVDMCGFITSNDTSPNVGKIKSQPPFKFIHHHRKNISLNGWHNARNHQQSQRRWGLTHRPHHIIVAGWKHISVTFWGVTLHIIFKGCACLSVSHLKLSKYFHNSFAYYVRI